MSAEPKRPERGWVRNARAAAGAVILWAVAAFVYAVCVSILPPGAEAQVAIEAQPVR